MRIVRAALAVAVLSAVVVAPSGTPAASAVGSVEISDPLLLAKIEEASTARTEGVPTVAVEVLTADQAGISVAVQALGGTVTGSVPGQIVQARVPVAKLTALANTPGARYLQYPRRSGRVPSERSRTEVQGTGTVGAEIGITGIGDWHDANLKGAGVKVGIVDYFNFPLWNVTENGPVPDSNHQFCQDTIPTGLCTTPTGGSIVNEINDGAHGVAVAEIVKDMAPGAELFVASVATSSDLQAAVNWFQSKGVTIITRSLGAAYDGPGDGTGPLDAVANSAVSKGMTWFNSAGNDAQDAYVRREVASTVTEGSKQYVDFDSGPGVDTWFRIDGTDIVFDGIRWSNDWYLPANQRTDYSVEFWAPNNTFNPDSVIYDDHTNPLPSQVNALGTFDDGFWGPSTVDANQRTGANPLEADDLYILTPNTYGYQSQGIVYMRVRRNTATPVGATPDVMEIALSNGLTELGYYDTAGTAGKPVADSKNPGVVAVGAVDPPGGTTIGYYSSQGPTNDGRIKPDVTAPSGFFSETYADTFSGTSAASPVAAGMAAVLQGAGLATPGEGTAALVKHFVADLGAVGADNVFGAGKIQMPSAPPAAGSTTPGKYVPLALPVRGLDTRPGTPDLPGLTGPYAPQSIIDFDVIHDTAVPDSGVSAVVLNVTSVDSSVTGYVQAYPYLRASNGGTSTLNISTISTPRPNFAIVPVGVDGKISIYLQSGGNVIVDVLGYYLDGQSGPVADGRFVPLTAPERWMDTRGQSGAPLPAVFSGTPRKATDNETILVPTLSGTALPDLNTVQALVVNITAAGPTGKGYLQAFTTGASGALHSNVNFTVGVASANTAIIPITGPNSMSVFTSKSTDIIVDVVGYITSTLSSNSNQGLFVPITPGRAYNSRTGPAFTTGESRTVQLTGLTPAPLPSVPSNAVGVSANLTVVNPPNVGFLTVYPGPTQPSTSNVNFSPGKTVANAALLALAPGGTVIATMSKPGHVLIDINGYFTPASA
ncbi:MAG: S8 family serine peptidase [Ilumatobacteraceae bacterium]